MTGSSYRVVSEVRADGDLLDVPSGARDVTVEPLGRPGMVRVTYLKPVREIAITGSDDDADRPSYLA
ncbi:hypothetical protein [Halorarum salinum]|uniref:Uncharacterized protein n=1 Tax=Halorarum salinum TaxID=2743089 RepID=A0A7D5Q943_9EURY|nr:hypothetical protein [Halobaculum salinum]QLG61417.1 hypothetical protein HUG12_06580 [Halobaculum salinum]